MSLLYSVQVGDNTELMAQEWGQCKVKLTISFSNFTIEVIFRHSKSGCLAPVKSAS